MPLRIASNLRKTLGKITNFKKLGKHNSFYERIALSENISLCFSKQIKERNYEHRNHKHQQRN